MWDCTHIKSFNSHDFVLTFSNGRKIIEIVINILKDSIDNIIKEYTESFASEPPIEVDRLQNLLHNNLFTVNS
jgi:hypothetical protein